MEFEFLSHNVIGKVIDSKTFSPLVGITVKISTSDGDFITKTDKGGLYELNFNLKYYQKELTQVPIFIEFIDNNEIYSPLRKSLLNKQNNQVKKVIGVARLKDSQNDLKDTIDGFQSNVKNTLQQVKNRIPKSPEETLINFAKNSIIRISKTLLPSILLMLAAFAITNIKDSLQINNSKCPSDDRLLKLINKRNKLVRVLNNIYKTLNTLSIVAGFAGGLATLLQIAKNILVNLPLPSPPRIPNSIIELDKNISRFRSSTNVLFIVIFVLRNSLSQTINLLNSLDLQIQKCSSNNDLEKINDELRNITKEEETDNISSPISVNGFKLEVQEIDKNTVGNLKRKQAVAINPQGVVSLRGEPSFSSSDNVLINQLAFFIQSNNLKAF
jgi:hypothetical protein